MKPFIPPVPTLTRVDRRLIADAAKLLDRLAERANIAGLDEPAITALAATLTAANDEAQRLALAYPEADAPRVRLSTVANADHPPVRPDFPLRPHDSGKWVAHFDRRAYYFGRLSDPAGAERQYLAFMGRRLDAAHRAAGLTPPSTRHDGKAVAHG